ncbi:hypothetical protein [Microcoleus sp. D3_18a_C4]
MMGSGEWGNVELRDLDFIIPTQPEKISEAIFGKDFSNVSNRLSGLFHN